MIRSILPLAAVSGLLACAQPAPPPALETAADACDHAFAAPIAFTAPDAKESVEARAFGPDCAKVVVTLTIRDASGAPLWVWASPRPWTAGEDAAAITAFLEDWAAVRVDDTSALPDWPDRETVFAGALGAFMETPFDRDTYLDLRAKALPRLCHATGVESGVCVYYDPSAKTVAKIFASGA